jgi:hypothetical protein
MFLFPPDWTYHVEQVRSVRPQVSNVLAPKLGSSLYGGPKRGVWRLAQASKYLPTELIGLSFKLRHVGI